METVAATDYVHFPKENILSKCNRHKVKGTLVNYKTVEKYTGKDEFDLLILYPKGFAPGTSFRHKRALNKPTTFAPASPEMLYGAFFIGR